MQPPRERACPRCGAPAAAPQRWCMECGHELPGPRRTGLRPAVGIATTLAVLVGAASAGAYTLLAHDRQPPPPATTVAQAPPATLPPATQEPAPYTPAPYTAPRTLPSPSVGRGGSAYRGGSSRRVSHGGSTSAGGARPGSTSTHGSVQPETHTTTTVTTPPRATYALSNVALGADAVVYAPYTAPDIDLGDPSRAVDGSTRTAWRAPAAADPTASPQLGLYVDLASRQKIRRLVLRTPTPGIDIEVYGATSGPPDSITDPGWDHVASRSGIGTEAKVKLRDRRFRYVLVWIVGAPPDGARAAISELELLSLQPE